MILVDIIDPDFARSDDLFDLKISVFITMKFSKLGTLFNKSQFSLFSMPTSNDLNAKK